MKKILFAIAFVMMMSFGANAQNDGWFKSSGYDDNYDRPTNPGSFALPNQHNDSNDNSAPLGSGLIILGALGAGYALARKRD